MALDSKVAAATAQQITAAIARLSAPALEKPPTGPGPTPEQIWEAAVTAIFASITKYASVTVPVTIPEVPAAGKAVATPAKVVNEIGKIT